MKNVIDVCNHILYYSEIYLGFEDVSDEMQADALRLTLKHGHEFVEFFVRLYLKTQLEVLNECD
jgi:hypothetical protein|tara:strand:+ start:281 stop:472 length:192 start_codon:yes stop_codon:yes gene_type:complete